MACLAQPRFVAIKPEEDPAGPEDSSDGVLDHPRILYSPPTWVLFFLGFFGFFLLV